MFKQVTALVVLAFAVLLVYSFTQTREVRTPADAIKIVSDDIEADPAIAMEQRLYEIFSAEREVNGQWRVITKITLNPHSRCPNAFIRTYQLLPIRHGVDKTITRDCVVGSPIAFAEEAIVAAGKLEQTRALELEKACAYELPLRGEKALVYCSDADLQQLDSFASELPEEAQWLVEWRSRNLNTLVALDARGNALRARSMSISRE